MSENADDHAQLRQRVEAAIGHIPDFPFKGFPFRDVTPLLEEDENLFRGIIDWFVDRSKLTELDCVLCIESFGYVFGAPVAYLVGARLVLARHAGKLPRSVHRQDYDMVYAKGRALEVHENAMRPGDRVLIVDDVLASGGSALAAVSLIEKAKAACVGIACVADAAFLSDWRDRVELASRGFPIVALANL